MQHGDAATPSSGASHTRSWRRAALVTLPGAGAQLWTTPDVTETLSGEEVFSDFSAALHEVLDEPRDIGRVTARFVEVAPDPTLPATGRRPRLLRWVFGGNDLDLVLRDRRLRIVR